MIYIYTRTDGGLIEYHGPHPGTVEQYLDDGCMIPAHLRPQPETEELCGWPHARVVWYGNEGFGED